MIAEASAAPPSSPTRRPEAPEGPFAPIAVMWLVSFALVGVSVKIQRIADLAWSSGNIWLLGWTPLLLGLDLLVGVAAFAGRGLLLRARVAPAAVDGLLAIVFTLTVLLQMGNAVAFRTVQSTITWQRLRGDEGVTLKNIGLLAPTDAAPAIVVLGTALIGIAGTLLLCDGMRLAHRRRIVLGVSAAAALFLVAAGVAAPRPIARLARQPVVELVRSAFEEEDPPVPALDFPERPTEDDWRRIERATTTTRVPEVPPPPKAGPPAKNVVIFLAESLSWRFSSLAGHADSTPKLAARAENGLVMTRFYASYPLSIQSIYSTVCSDWAVPTGTNIVAVNARIDCGELSQVLAGYGVNVGLFHAGNFGFYDKLALLGRRGYVVQKDAQILAQEHVRAGAEAAPRMNHWGIDDAAMTDAALAWIDAQPKDARFAALLIPISAHYPYEVWKGTPRYRGRDARSRYLSAVSYLDGVFDAFMRGLEARGLLEETAVVFVGDHGEGVREPLREHASLRLHYETHLHVPFVLWSPTLPGPARSNRVAALRDILPTVLDVMGFPPDPRHRGRSIFAPDWTPSRVLFGSRGDGGRFVGLIDQETKFVLDLNRGDMEVYDLAEDVLETNNLVDEIPQSQLAAWSRDARAFLTWQGRRLEEAPSLGDEIDVHGEVEKAAQFTVVLPDPAGERRLDCDVDPAACAPWVHGRRAARAGREKRDCFVVQAPPGGQVELSLADSAAHPWMSTLAVVRSTFLDGAKIEGFLAIEAKSDDAPLRQEPLKDRTVKGIRVEFSPPQREVRITVRATTGTPPPVCLTFSEVAWRNAKPGGRGVDDQDDDDRH